MVGTGALHSRAPAFFFFFLSLREAWDTTSTNTETLAVNLSYPFYVEYFLFSHPLFLFLHSYSVLLSRLFRHFIAA